MDSPDFMLGALLIIVALALIVVCIPLLKGWIGMNRWYGFRFPQSYKSDEHWYEINRYGARQMIVWSVVLSVLGIIAYLSPPRKASAGALFLSFAPLVVLIPVVRAYLYARRLRERDRDVPSEGSA